MGKGLMGINATRKHRAPSAGEQNCQPVRQAGNLLQEAFHGIHERRRNERRRTAGNLPQEAFHGIHERRRTDGSRRRPLRVLKFGGTSVGDAACIGRVVDIVRAELCESNVVVVISAMSGVTNKLVAAAKACEAGDQKTVARILEELRTQHEAAAAILIHSTAERKQISRTMKNVFREADALCKGAMLLRELTPRTLDAISSLGERLSTPLVAAALAERGVASEAIDATKLVVTDSSHGAAEPLMDLTRGRCEALVRPLLQQGIVPVATGFIGATVEGLVTTLGRNGSDYSATILGAALDALEVVIWSDVDGVLTVDPRLVPGVRTIPEISYRSAAELAYFGAKVLHPKTLRPVMQSGTPIWIRNTFAPEGRGTKITPDGHWNGGGVKALSAVSDVTLITVGGGAFVGIPDVLVRIFKTTSAIPAEVLLISQSSSQKRICLVVPSSTAGRTLEGLRREFASELPLETVEQITFNPDVAIVAVVGEILPDTSRIVGRMFGALDRDKVKILAIAQGSSECSISFLVAKNDMKKALETIHREFKLGASESPETAASMS
ncbi:MAG TPA: aspartate kinase [Candidatus Dormibacteraeota bacterium]|nr:aspartate kinase [Candidatus Dormibacteraeota bacterium]